MAIGPSGQVVQDDVAPQAGGDAVGGRAPQQDGAELVVHQLEQPGLGPDLRDAVRRDRVEGGGLVQQIVAASAVVAAGRREQEPLGAGVAGEPGELDRGPLVDVVGELGIEVAEWIVRQRGEVDDGVDALEIGRLDVADVPADLGDLGERAGEAALPVVVGVHPDDLDAVCEQHRDQHRSDVSLVPSDQYAHDRPPSRSKQHSRTPGPLAMDCSAYVR